MSLKEVKTLTILCALAYAGALFLGYRWGFDEGRHPKGKVICVFDVSDKPFPAVKQIESTCPTNQILTNVVITYSTIQP